MFLVKKQKSQKQIEREYAQLVKDNFSKVNKFFYELREIAQSYPGRIQLQEWVKNVELDASYSREFELLTVNESEEMFTVNADTAEYFMKLLTLEELLNKCNYILRSSAKPNQQYLRNELYDATYLLRELDQALRNGVPLTQNIIQDSVDNLTRLLSETLDNYYQKTLEALVRENEIIKELRQKYTMERNALIEDLKRLDVKG